MGVFLMLLVGRNDLLTGYLLRRLFKQASEFEAQTDCRETLDARKFDDVIKARNAIKNRTMFKAQSSNYWLRLIQCLSRRKAKKRSTQDKAEDALGKQFDIVRVLRQQMLLTRLLKVKFTPLERYFL